MQPHLTEALELYMQSLNPLLAPRTAFNKRYYTEMFLNFIEKQDYHDLQHLDINLVYEFIVSLDYASQTISNIQFVLRDFFNIIYEALSDL